METQIRYEGLSYPRSVNAFVMKRIERWLRNNVPPAGETPWVQVSFEREGLGHTIRCYAQIISGSVLWQGTFAADGPHQALARTLDRLTPRFLKPVRIARVLSFPEPLSATT